MPWAFCIAILSLTICWYLEAEDNFIAGTIGYTAPEIFAGETATLKSDVYAAGIVESLIFGADTPPIIKAVRGQDVDMQRAKRSAENYKFPNFLNDMPEFECHREALATTFYQMIKPDAQERSDLRVAIAGLEEVSFARKKSLCEPALLPALAQAHQRGSQLRRELLSKQNNVARELQISIKDQLQDWDKVAIDMFLSGLRVRALYGCDDKKMILQRMADIIAKYDETYQAVSLKEQALSQSTEPGLQHALYSCRHVLDKCMRARLSLDEMEHLTFKLQKRLQSNEPLLVIPPPRCTRIA